jgi:DNA-binding transcriptional ArsR family regulator
MAQNIDEKEIISKLFVKREDIVERLNGLVNLSHGLIIIVQETGEVYLDDSININNNEKIFLLLLGSYFSFKSQLKKAQEMNISELAMKLGVPSPTMPAPLNKLIEERLVVKTGRGHYSINFDNYKKVKEMLLKIKEKNGKS